MIARTTTLPPRKVIAATLRKTTELLARELASPGAHAPDWNDFEWGIARAVAAMQGISALLASGLRWRGPPQWEEFLTQQSFHTAARDRRIGELLTVLERELRSTGIPAVGLKGAALRELGLYTSGQRPMGDIDLLIDRGQRASIANALGKIGYREAFASWRDTVFEPIEKKSGAGFGEHVDYPLKIEVHTDIAENLPISVVCVTPAIWPAGAKPGLNAYPSYGSLMFHLLLHAAGNMRAHALRMIQLQDIARLATRMSARDWNEILAPAAQASTWWAYPTLALTARYFPEAIDARVVARARVQCPGALRRATARWQLTDVSWSNMRIDAFPGIVWSRDLAEAVRFAKSRVWPSHDALAEMNYGQLAQPQFAQVPWYGLSHGMRVVRWVFSRPPRVQTITSVRAALGVIS